MIKPAPRGSDPETIRAEILEKLAYSIGKDPAVRTRLEPLGMITIQTPEQFAAHIKTETNLLADVIKRSNIKAE